MGLLVLICYTNNMNRENKTTEAYNKIAEDYSQRNSNHFFVNEYVYYKSLLSGNKIVDLGCGAGRDGEHFFADGFSYLGIDSSSEMLKIANNKVVGGQFKLMDLRKLDLPLESFDGFWASAALLHFFKAEVPNILKSFYNLLKKDGIGFISVKDKVDFDEGFIQENKCGGIERYFSFYTEDEFRAYLEEVGFKIIKVTYIIEADKFNTKWLCFFVKK
jgi:ubiquinone/menaquinone biosynthesis C-methylase UbiE